MATFNSTNTTYQSGNKTLFEANMLATPNGQIVSATNPLPVTLGSENITITGDVNVGTTVSVTSTPEEPVHVHLTEIGNTSITELNYVPVGGIVSVNNFPSSQNTSIHHSNGANITADVPLSVTGIITTGNQGKLWGLQVSEGSISGHSFIQTTGYNPTTAAGDAVWAGGTPFPWASLATAQTLYLKSSTNNATDRSMPIVITGLDSNYDVLTETISLNASDSRTAVSTINQFLRISNMRVDGTEENVGDITAHVTSGTGTLVNKMLAGRGMGSTGTYTIPAGKTGYLFKGDASSTAATVVDFNVRYFGKAFIVAHIAIVDNATYIYDFPFPSVLPEKTDMYCKISAGSGKTAINYEILIVDN